MIITCPNCSTKYEVADQAIGATGRKVQCANCHRSWQATAPEHIEPAPKPRIVGGTDTDIDEVLAEATEHDRLFGTDAEDELDKAFAAEEEKELASAESAESDDSEDESIEDMVDEQTGKLDHRLLSRQRRDMHRRQQKHVSRLPLARLRRTARIVALLMLASIVGGGYVFRADIVRSYPSLGGLYGMVGIDVNIYGLIFTKVETLRTLRDGDDVTIITANIRSIVDHTVRVPPVLVSILNAEGKPIYEWTASAPVANISPGDIVAFETQLTSAPIDAAHVRLIFGQSNASQQGSFATPTSQGAR